MVHKFIRVSRLVFAGAALCATAAAAQGTSGNDRQASKVPSSALPPAGLCRVWLKDVPAGQQPAPTDCASAIRRAPPTATILFGGLRKEATVQSRPGPGTATTGVRLDDVPAHSAATPPRRAPRRAEESSGPARTIAPAGGARGGQAARVTHPTPPPPPAKPPEKPLS